MAAKKATKGKRYSAEEKQAAIDFVNAHNNDNGRGGVTAAVKKFGASALTISTWMKSTSSGARSGKGIATTRLATGGKHLRLTVNKNPQATNLTYAVETCSALDEWSEIDTVVEANSPTQLIVRDTLSTSVSPRRFIRRRVSRTP